MHPAGTKLALAGPGDKWPRGWLIRPKARAMNHQPPNPNPNPTPPIRRWPTWACTARDIRQGNVQKRREIDKKTNKTAKRAERHFWAAFYFARDASQRKVFVKEMCGKSGNVSGEKCAFSTASQCKTHDRRPRPNKAKNSSVDSHNVDNCWNWQFDVLTHAPNVKRQQQHNGHINNYVCIYNKTAI